jgi:hypothetical protein
MGVILRGEMEIICPNAYHDNEFFWKHLQFLCSTDFVDAYCGLRLVLSGFWSTRLPWKI